MTFVEAAEEGVANLLGELVLANLEVFPSYFIELAIENFLV